MLPGVGAVVKSRLLERCGQGRISCFRLDAGGGFCSDIVGMKENQTLKLALSVLLAGASLALVTQGAELDNSSSASQSSSGGLAWLTDLPKAQGQAKAAGKYVLLFFHGSDWCPPCIEMQRQVFDSPEFAKYARQTLVLVDVDFPEKRPQDEGLKRANLALKTKFNMNPEPGEGVPAVVLLNGDGETVFQETGYDGGGSAAFLAHLRRHCDSLIPKESGRFQNLTVDEFAKMAVNKQNVILDVRTAKEFEAGHLPGAMNLDVNAADFEEKAAALDKSKVYLVHCASGVRSVRACEKLARLDFHALYNLPGGFKAWVKAGQAVEQ
jgi:protein disulfide-isomerase